LNKFLTKLILAFFLSISTLITFGCKTDKKDLLIANQKYESKPLNGININIDSLYYPGLMSRIDSILVLQDFKTKKPFHFINLNNHKYLKSFGTRGKGPGEFIGLNTINSFDKKLWAYDITLSKYVSFDLDSILKFGRSKYRYSEEIIFTNDARKNYCPLFINDTLLSSLTFSNSKHRILLSNKADGQVSNELFDMIEPVEKTTPQRLHNESYHGVMEKHPLKNLLFIGSRYADLIEIYNLNSNKGIRIKTHDNFTPEFRIDNSQGFPSIVYNGQWKHGYLDISVTENVVFTLFSGRTTGDYANRNSLGNTVLLYDWDGNYIASYSTDIDGHTIEAINDEEFVLCGVHNGISYLKRYKI